VIVIRVTPAKDVLHETPGSYGSKVDRLVGQRHRDAMYLFGLPSLLDAVVDKCHETCCHNDAEVMLVSACSGQGLGSNLLGNIGNRIYNGVVCNPHEARRNPSTGVLIGVNLVG